MGRSLNDVVAALPKARRARIAARSRALHDEVESLSELRRVVGKAQIEIAAALKVRQPTVSRLVKQTDMYLSTLRSYVEAMGGRLELTVHLPRHAPLRLDRLGSLGPEAGSSATSGMPGRYGSARGTPKSR